MTPDDKTFNEPKIAINRVYTRKGDAGSTRLVGGQKVGKHALRIDTYGTIDELGAYLGAARVSVLGYQRPEHDALAAELLRVQHELFNLGSVLATLPEDVIPQMPQVTQKDVAALERSIDHHNESLPPLRSFVLAGGSRANADLHIARTVCRRAERLMVALGEQEEVPGDALAYINRLSDALFVWSRWVSCAAGVKEVLWEPNKAASASQG